MIRPRKAVARVDEYVPVEEGRASLLRLDLNENTVGCPPGLVRALRRILTPEWCAIYPEYEESAKTVARYYGVSPSEMIMTNGVDDAVMLICDTFVDPGDVLVIPSPTFSIYRFFHQVREGKVRTVSYDGKARLSVEGLIRAGRGARWMAIANPNNPTGTLIPPPDLKVLLEALPRTLVLVDEAYFDFAQVTILPWIRRFPNLIVSRTLSKAFGLAALRIGLLFADRSLTSAMRRIHAAYAVNGVAAACAAAAIRFDKQVGRYGAAVCENRSRFSEELERLGIPYVPSRANFVLIHAGPRSRQVALRLRRKGILVRDWKHDPKLKPCLRVTIGARPQMERLTRALPEVLPMIRKIPGGAQSFSGWFK